MAQKMGKLFRITCAILVLVLAPYANAETKVSGPFYLEDMPIPPSFKGQYPDLTLLGFYSLPKYGYFDVTCDIENPNYANAYPVVLGINTGRIDATLSGTGQYLLNKPVSKFVISSVASSSGIFFSNYDTTDTVYLKNCKAVYSTP